jgi:hypothetical protein
MTINIIRKWNGSQKSLKMVLCYKLLTSIMVLAIMSKTAAANETVILCPTENYFFKMWCVYCKAPGHMHKDKTAFTYYLLTDIAFARHLTQLSKCLTEQMGLIRLPQGMSTLTMPRGVNAPIWHLCAFPQQKIHH